MGGEAGFGFEGFEGKEGGSGKVHIRAPQRNGRTSWTIVSGLPEKVRLPKSGRALDVDFDKILRALRRSFRTNGTLIRDEDHGIVVQLQGDIRREVADFLVDFTMLVTKDQVVIHGW